MHFHPGLVKPAQTYKEDVIASYDQLKEICHYLFTEYVKTGVELEINVSYEVRSNLEGLMYDKEQFEKMTMSEFKIQDLYTVYDATIIELSRLLVYSFRRFRNLNLTKLDAIMNQSLSESNCQRHSTVTK